MSRQSGERRTEDRRCVEDRRSLRATWLGEDRRKGERRKRLSAVQAERRAGRDRRSHLRRSGGGRRSRFGRRTTDRRRQTPIPYSAEDADKIREMVARPGEQAICPVCNGELTLGYPIARVGGTVREVRCWPCRRGVMIADYRMARALIVDDEDVSRDTLRIALTRAGHEVVEASEAGAALQAFRENPADIVLVSLLMPANTGLEFLRRLRRDYPDAKVIAISGQRRYGAPDPLAMAKTLGASHILRKPFTPGDLLRALESVLERRSRAH